MNNFLAYEILNEQLFMLIMQGKGDSESAEALRDTMDYHWEKMSEEEKNRMRKQNEKQIGT